MLFAFGGILAQVSSIVDCADGRLARARDHRSEYGAYLDLVLDRVSEFFLMMGCTRGYFFYSGRLDLLILGFITIASITNVDVLPSNLNRRPLWNYNRGRPF